MTSCTVLQTSPYPVYEIELDKLSAPIDISSIVKSFGTKKYVYTFEFESKIIKHGISVDEKSIPGERIYRQAGHLEGWKSRLAPGSAGDDMREISAKFCNKTGSPLNRKGMKIVVRDVTNVDSPSITDKNFYVKQLERQLIKDYANSNNELPIGNIKDESYVDTKRCVTKDTWDKFFEFN